MSEVGLTPQECLFLRSRLFFSSHKILHRSNILLSITITSHWLAPLPPRRLYYCHLLAMHQYYKMQSLSNTVFGLNTRAASLLHEGSIREANDLFQQAIDKFTSPARSMEDGGSSRKRYTISVAPVAVHRGVSVLDESFSPDNTFVFYSKTFLYGVPSPEGDHGDEIDPETWRIQLTAILLYNWGVANQCAAIRTGCERFLQRAFKIYSRAFDVLTHRQMDLTDDSTLLLLALYNNMGYCCSHLSEKESEQRCHEYIRSISCNAERSQAFRGEYVIFDTSNVFLDHGRPTSNFASAAWLRSKKLSEAAYIL